MLTEALSPGHGLPPPEPELNQDQDAVRLASALPSPAIAGRLAAGTARQRAELELAVRAWQFGAVAALSALEEEWTPEPEALARAATALAEAWEAADRPQLRAAGPARWTVVGAEAQLRLGRDGRWWPYRKERGRWAPAGPADHDPAAALAGVLGETGALGGTGAAGHTD